MRTFMEWYALYRIDPWGERREDLRMALATYQTILPHLSKKAASKFSVKDCLYTPPIDTTNETDESIEARAMAWARTRNAAGRKGLNK